MIVTQHDREYGQHRRKMHRHRHRIDEGQRGGNDDRHVHANAMTAAGTGMPARTASIVVSKIERRTTRVDCHDGSGYHCLSLGKAHRREAGLSEDKDRKQPRHRCQTTAQAGDQGGRGRYHRRSLAVMASVRQFHEHLPAKSAKRGIFVKQRKTGTEIIIGWTPRLRTRVDQAKQHQVGSMWLVADAKGQRYTLGAVRTA